MFVIVYLDLTSDDNGIQNAYGPYSEWWEASDSADKICERFGWVRGVDIQVAKLNPTSELHKMEANF